jgi:hypothetical protein
VTIQVLATAIAAIAMQQHRINEAWGTRGGITTQAASSSRSDMQRKRRFWRITKSTAPRRTLNWLVWCRWQTSSSLQWVPTSAISV